MNVVPKRRWFRFSLRTLFLAFGTVCIALGWVMWNLNWIRARREMAEAEQGRPFWTWPAPKGKAPSTLWIFGETGWQNLTIYYETEEEAALNRDRAKALFPEAAVSVVVWQE
jgi:hypothetical protein